MVDSVSYTTKSCKMVFPISFLVYSVNYHVCLLITTTVVSEDNYSRQGFMAINNPACGLGIGWFVDHCLPWFKYNTRHFVLPFSFNEGSGRLSNSTTPPSLLPPPSSLLLSLLSPHLQTVNTRTQALRMGRHMSGNMLSRIIKVLLPHRASWRRTIPRLQTCTLYTRRDTDSLVGEVRREGRGKGGGERVKRERGKGRRWMLHGRGSCRGG